MKDMTAPELTSIREQLTQEQNLVIKYRHCASEVTDEALKTKFEDMAERHQKHYDKLYGLLG